MPSSSPDPVIVSADGTAAPLQRLPQVHGEFNERYLQDLLAAHPELLPVAQLRPDVGQLVCIGREVSVASGSIDNLYLSTGGYPVIVETKLWRNPQARREVLSQVLDYIKDVTREDFEWFARQSRQWDASSDLISRLNEASVDEVDERSLHDRVNLALRRGDVLAMIVGDGIETRLQELVNHLCEQSSHLRYSLALVELGCYKLDKAGEGSMLVVPRIVQEVEPVKRAHIVLDFADGLERQLKVSAETLADKEPAKAPRPTLDEAEFYATLEAEAGSRTRAATEGFVADLLDTFDLTLAYGSTAVVLKLPHPDDEGPDVSLLAIKATGEVYNPRRLTRQLGKWQMAEPTVARIASAYWGGLHRIDRRFTLDGVRDTAPRHSLVPFTDVSNKLAEIKAEVEKVVRAIRAAHDNHG